jgi:hypothetical protein
VYGVFDAITIFGSTAFEVLSNKEKAAKAGLVSQLIPTSCTRDDFLRKLSLNARSALVS